MTKADFEGFKQMHKILQKEHFEKKKAVSALTLSASLQPIPFAKDLRHYDLKK